MDNLNTKFSQRAGSDPDGPDQRVKFQPSPKLKDKIEKLAKWRIDRARIDIPHDVQEIRGGHATVARCFLAPLPSGSGESKGEEEHKFGSNLSRKKLAVREAGLLSDLSHTNVVKLEGFVEDLSDDVIWLVFPWEENGNLRDFIASQDWEIPERISLISDVTQGVAYLHGHDPPIYHGDLKSVGYSTLHHRVYAGGVDSWAYLSAFQLNVVVNGQCQAVITDFGSARSLPHVKSDSKGQQPEAKQGVSPNLQLLATFSDHNHTMTLTGTSYTLRWAAPELLMTDEAGLESDVWALGWIYYEASVSTDYGVGWSSL
ncbi:hypothetical protein FRB90_006533 [Tulasnella sp. 427]|nr:hypothetical protein FRB90_006533 [Tulasnella sp. 427]